MFLLLVVVSQFIIYYMHYLLNVYLHFTTFITLA